MKMKILKLARSLLKRGLYSEAFLCLDSLEKEALGSTTQSDPYGAMSNSGTPLAWVRQECYHDYDENEFDNCPICGKS